MGRKLTLDDITDLRAYERERDAFRTRIMALKRRRRISLGPIMSLTFENRDTIRFQIQEMARAERLISDAAIQAELDTYNPLIPEPGELSATLFIELTSRDALREWLPKLVGIERAVELRIDCNGTTDVVRSVPETAHEQQLTRETATASVHYVRFQLTAAQTERFARGTVSLAAVHQDYQHQTTLSEDAKAALLEDLRAA